MTSQQRYFPYGEPRPGGQGSSPTDFGFTAQRNEASFGLMDYNARYYSPLLGRFVSPDSIVPEPSSSGGFNRYRYARNSPLMYTDPTGHVGCLGCNTFQHQRAFEDRAPVAFRPPRYTGPQREPIVDGTATLSVGVSGSFVYEGGVAVDIYHTDEQGNWAIGTITTNPIGGSTAVGGSASVAKTVTNGENIGELQGWFVATGFGGGAGLGGGVNGIVGAEGKNGTIVGSTAYGWAGPKIGAPFDGMPVIYYHGGATYTTDWAVATYRVDGEKWCILNECTLSSFQEPYQEQLTTPVEKPVLDLIPVEKPVLELTPRIPIILKD